VRRGRETFPRCGTDALQRPLLRRIVGTILLPRHKINARGSSQGAQLEVYTLHSPLDAIQQR
jgi:hypothetical protein